MPKTPSKTLRRVPILLCVFLITLCTKEAHSSEHAEIDSMKMVLQQALQKGEDVAKSYFELGEAYMSLGQYGLALDQFALAQQKAEEEADSKLFLKALDEKAYALTKIGKNKEALDSFVRGKEIADSLKLLDIKADFLFSIGNYFRLQRQVPTAIDYLDQAGVIYQELGDEASVCGKVNFTKAITYKVSDDDAEMEKSIGIYEEMLQDHCRKHFNEFQLSKVYSNLGACYIDVEDFSKAEENLLFALRLKQKFNRPVSLAYTYNELSSLYVRKSNHKKALEYAEQAYEYAQQGEDIHLNIDILENLAVNYFHLDMQNKGFYYLHQSQALSDSIQNKKYLETIAELEMKYETAQKDQEIIRKEFQLSAQENRLKLFAILSISLLALAIGVFLWYRNRLKNKESEARSLEKLDQMRKRYFTNISHELRTPLSLIVDPINRLKAGINNPEQQSLLQTASRNADRMLQLVNQMLDLSKLEAGKLPLEAQKADLVSELNFLVDSFQQEAKRKQIVLSYLPDEEVLEAYFDRDKLEKIISNLLSNALKFTSAKGSVTLLLFKRGQKAEIILKDTGKGIPEEKLPLVFNRFYQVDDSYTREFEGTGIGLSLVKELVELHHGEISIKSKLGKGTTLILQFPLGKAHLSKAEIYTPAQKPHFVQKKKTLVSNPEPQTDTAQFISDGGPQTDLPKILIVEDNEDVRQYILQQFSQKYEILEAANGLDGLESAIDNIPDLIVSDIMMPGMDGHELCTKIKNDERTSHIPIILLTAKVTREDKITGLKNRADDYLSKPFDSEELIVRIQNLVEQRKQLQQKYAKGRKISPKDISVNSVDESFLERLLNIIEQNMDNEKFGVEELSHAIGMSRSQLHRKLKALTGQSTSIFLRSIRLQRAYQLLEQAAGNASEIAFKVGFSNPNYFFKCFKDEFSITPGQVLKGQKAPDGINN